MEILQADLYSSKNDRSVVFYPTKCLHAQVTIVSAMTMNREEQEEENIVAGSCPRTKLTGWTGQRGENCTVAD